MIKFSHKEIFSGLGKLGAWFVAARVVNLTCMVLVTRVLDPSDFTVIAAVMAIQGVILRFSSINLYSELVRSETLDLIDLRTAWSYETLRNIGLAVLIYAGAPLFSGWLERPETTTVFRVAALTPLIAVFISPRLLEARRERRFGLLGGLESVSTISYGIAAVILVQWRADYWALVWAGVASALCRAAVTSVALPWLPVLNFSWKRAKPLFRLGIVLQLNAVCNTLREHGLIFVLVIYGLQDDLGFYNRAAAFSLALTFQLLTLIWKVTYPSFSQAERDGHSSFGIAFSFQNKALLFFLITAPVVIPLIYWLLPIVLGEKWIPMMPLWTQLAVASCVMLASVPVEVAFQSTRNERTSLWIYASMMVLQLSVAAVTVAFMGLNGAGVAVLISAVAGLVVGRLLGRGVQGGVVCKAGV